MYVKLISNKNYSVAVFIRAENVTPVVKLLLPVLPTECFISLSHWVYIWHCIQGVAPLSIGHFDRRTAPGDAWADRNRPRTLSKLSQSRRI